MDHETLTTARGELVHRQELSAPSRAALIFMINDLLGLLPRGYPIAFTIPVAPLPAADATANIALCLGHARSGDQGAVSVGGISEENWYLQTSMLERVQDHLEGIGIRSFVVTTYQGNTYPAAMDWLAKHLRERGATAAVEFHFNAGVPSACGHEVLYHEFSRFGIRLAEMINKQWSKDLPGPDRGTKPRKTGDRGAMFLSRTHCPAAILEPFFGSNKEDWKWFSANPAKLAASTALGIAEFVKFYRNQKP